MKILSYNIHGGIGTDKIKDYRRAYQIMRQFDIDIALLQEVESRADMNAHIDELRDLHAPPYDHYATGPTYREEDGEGWYGNMIVSRFPIIEEYSHNISVPLRSKRCVLEVLIDTPRGNLACMNTHFGLSGVERRFQTRALAKILENLKNERLVVMGDFNQWLPFSPMKRILSQYLADHRAGPTFPSKFPFLNLDRTWSRPADMIKHIEVIRTPETRIVSDHLPVMAVVEF